MSEHQDLNAEWQNVQSYRRFSAELRKQFQEETDPWVRDTLAEDLNVLSGQRRRSLKRIKRLRGKR